MVMKVAVIGAGAAGLACARRLKENEDISFVIYEQAGEVGGTWVYDERIGTDEYGIPIHTSMYRSLRTNLPKEVMGYPDFPILKPADKSYIPSADILKFLNEFTEHFDLRKYIKFRHWVKSVKPLENKWVLEANDVVHKNMITEIFDAVMVCNGHYEVANIPKMTGQDIFQGKQIHSHDYRIPEAFAGQTVVIIGAGPSGLDIGLDVSSHAKTVYLSHHLPDAIDTPFPDNFYFKPDIKEIKENGVVFIDGTYADVDCVFYCTGYKYCFPFLSENCGVRIRDNHVHPLFKHLISIEHPSLCFVGLPFYVCAFSMFDLQARVFINTLTGQCELPSKEKMLEDEEAEMKRRKEMKFHSRDAHKMGPLQMEYYDELARVGNVERLPHVLTKLHNESSRRFLEDLRSFRNDKYKIIDDETYQEIV